MVEGSELFRESSACRLTMIPIHVGPTNHKPQEQVDAMLLSCYRLAPSSGTLKLCFGEAQTHREVPSPALNPKLYE